MKGGRDVMYRDRTTGRRREHAALPVRWTTLIVTQQTPWAAAIALAAAAIAVYTTSFQGAFVFDDFPAIVDNATIRSFSPWWAPLVPPSEGSTVARPVVNLSFALNYAWGGLDPWGYHAINLAIHIAAGLALFGILRRLLNRPDTVDWLRSSSTSVAFCAALVWLVHPLQTESVTSIVQRTESLGGLFYLLTLYGFVRAADPAVGATPSGGRRWLVFSWFCCLVGIATKEFLATAPLFILLVDRAFVSGRFAEALARRKWFYAGLVGTWLPLGFLIWQGQGRGGTVTLGRDIDMWVTLLTQARAIGTYLGLAIWPQTLVIDYGRYGSDAVRSLAEVWPQGMLILALIAATVVAVAKWPRTGVLGAWFFVVLAPSSSFIPLLTQARAEHRMYLPLAALATGIALIARRCFDRRAPAVIVVLAVVLGTLASARNLDYRSPLALWSTTVADFPGNPRAHFNLGNAWRDAGEHPAAIKAYTDAVVLDPEYAAAHANLAVELSDAGKPAEALPHAQAAVRLDPASGRARNTLARVLLDTRDFDGAVRESREALRRDPTNPGFQRNLALSLAAGGHLAEAVVPMRQAIASHPDADSYQILGDMLRDLGRAEEASAAYGAALALQPLHAMANFQVADLLFRGGDPEGSLAFYQRAIQGMPAAVPPRYNLGLALAALGRTGEAAACFEALLHIAPDDAGIREQLKLLHSQGAAAPMK